MDFSLRLYGEGAWTPTFSHLSNLKSKDYMNNTLSSAIKNALLKVLEEEDMTISDISNYNMSRAAATGIFTIILYKNTKTKKGDKKSVKLKLDSSTSTLVAAIDTIDAMIQEDSRSSFLSKIEEEKQTFNGNY